MANLKTVEKYNLPSWANVGLESSFELSAEAEAEFAAVSQDDEVT